MKNPSTLANARIATALDKRIVGIPGETTGQGDASLGLVVHDLPKQP
jgi:hypothetical protein